MNIAAARADALAEYARAQALDWQYNDWRGLAERLAALIPAPKAKAVDPSDRSQWADYKVRITWRSPHFESHSVRIGFADGEIVNAGCVSDRRKPVNWGHAMRVGIAFWKNRQRHYERMRRGWRYGVDPAAWKEQELDAFQRALVPPAIVSMSYGQWTCREILQ